MTLPLERPPVVDPAAAVKEDRVVQRADGVAEAAARESGALFVHRLLLVLAALSLFGGGFNAWMAIVQLRLVGGAAVAVLGLALVALIAAVAARSSRALARIDQLVLGLGLLTLTIWSASHLYFNPGYGTDEAAFVQYSGHLLVHGVNPYRASMLPALTRFHVPIQFATYMLDGGVSGQLSYPPLPMLIAIPFIGLTHGVQSMIIANVAFLALSMVLCFFLLPRQLRPLSVLMMVGLPILFGYTMSGMNDLLMLPFLLIVAHRWIEIGRAGRLGKRGVIQGIALGCALCVKQLAWFIAPFVVLGIWQARSREQGLRSGTAIAGRYVAVALATGAVVNLPFAIWNPGAWIRGVFAPITQHAVPYGQGLVDASLFFRLGGGNVAAYTYAGLALYIGALFLQARFFATLGRAAFIVPSFILFFPARSLAAYFMTMFAVWIVSVCTCRPSRFRAAAIHAAAGRRLLVAAVCAAACGSAVLVGTALASPAPLEIMITRATTNGQLQGVWQLTLQVRNHSSHTLEPHFATNSFGQLTTFWHIIRGPRRLHPHASATYVLDAPNLGSMPGITTPFLLQAVTEHPATISSAPLYTPQKYTTYIVPGYVNRVLRLGQTVTFRVELRSPYGARVRQPGVAVALGQLIYGESELIPAQAEINQGNIGQSPVIARTDANGIATFHVLDREPENGNAVYLQAWIAPPGAYPFGYSDIVSVLWR